MKCGWADNWTIDGKYAWMIPGEGIIGIHRIDLEINKCDLLYDIPVKYSQIAFRPFSFVVRVNDKLYCLPDTADSVLIYDISTSLYHEVQIGTSEEDRVAILTWNLYDNVLYLWASGIGQVIGIDTNQDKVIKKIVLPSDKRYGHGVFCENDIWIVTNARENIIRVDLIKETFEYFCVKNIQHPMTISDDGKYLWITGIEREIYGWDKSSNEAEVISIDFERFGIRNVEDNKIDKDIYDINKRPFHKSTGCINGSIFLFPFWANEIVEINTLEKSLSEVKMFYNPMKPCDFSVANEAVFIFLYVRESRYIGMYHKSSNKHYELDLVDNKFMEKEIEYTGSALVFVGKNYYCKEQKDTDLIEYIENI